MRGAGFRLYSIDNIVDAKSGRHWYRFTRCAREFDRGVRVAPRLTFAGTGGMHLYNSRASWERSLLSLIKACDRGKVSDRAVADRLAAMSYETHLAVRDGTVGPRCIVLWRGRPDGHQGGGGGHQFYRGTEREADSGMIPTIANGMDVQAIAGVLMKQMLDRLAGGLHAAIDLDVDELNRQLGQLPDGPDEKLR